MRSHRKWSEMFIIGFGVAKRSFTTYSWVWTSNNFQLDNPRGDEMAIRCLRWAPDDMIEKRFKTLVHSGSCSNGLSYLHSLRCNFRSAEMHARAMLWEYTRRCDGIYCVNRYHSMGTNVTFATNLCSSFVYYFLSFSTTITGWMRRDSPGEIIASHAISKWDERRSLNSRKIWLFWYYRQ